MGPSIPANHLRVGQVLPATAEARGCIGDDGFDRWLTPPRIVRSEIERRNPPPLASTSPPAAPVPPPPHSCSLQELEADLTKAGVMTHLVGGADVASELDAKRAIDQVILDCL